MFWCCCAGASTWVGTGLADDRVIYRDGTFYDPLNRTIALGARIPLNNAYFGTPPATYLQGAGMFVQASTMGSDPAGANSQAYLELTGRATAGGVQYPTEIEIYIWNKKVTAATFADDIYLADLAGPVVWDVSSDVWSTLINGLPVTTPNIVSLTDLITTSGGFDWTTDYFYFVLKPSAPIGGWSVFLPTRSVSHFGMPSDLATLTIQA